MNKDPNDFTWSDWAEQQFSAAKRQAQLEIDKVKEDAPRCHDCHMADLGFKNHKHCGGCYCCK